MARAGQAAAILLTLVCARGAAVTAGSDGRTLKHVQPVRISSNSDFSVFDCDFKASEMFGGSKSLLINRLLNSN